MRAEWSRPSRASSSFANGGRLDHCASRSNQTELPRNPRVAHLEVGVEIDDSIVPMQLVLVDLDRHSRGKKRLGHRPDLEDGPGVHRRPALAADAEAFGVNQLVAGDDTDRKAGYIEALHVGRD